MTVINPSALPRAWATLSLDLDNLWSYQRSFGIEAWRHYPSFLELALPRILDLLDRLDLRLTLFIVGRDAEQTANRPLLAEAVRRGHEAANHSYDHDPALHRWPRARIREEIARADRVIEEATGERPRGFRGPAYGLSARLLKALRDLAYDYDASSYPNSLGLLARLYHRRQASRLGSQACVADSLYGSLRDARQPLKPYCWSLAQGAVIEVPVTTLPLLRLPFHGTYLNYLGDFSPSLAQCYFGTALRLCRLRGVPPSFLLHVTDFLGGDDCAELTYLPGMKRKGADKTAFMAGLLESYGQAFHVGPIGAFVDELQALRQPLPLVSVLGA
ncbi:MAG: polysaccharide deacetylase family protein [Kiloniellaceae bacterium]